jgi:tape measure domain-containing protein
MADETILISISETGSRVVARSFEDVAKSAEKAQSVISELQGDLKNLSFKPGSELGKQFTDLTSQVGTSSTAVGKLRDQLNSLRGKAPGEITKDLEGLAKEFESVMGLATQFKSVLASMAAPTLKGAVGEQGEMFGAKMAPAPVIVPPPVQLPLPNVPRPKLPDPWDEPPPIPKDKGMAEYEAKINQIRAELLKVEPRTLITECSNQLVQLGDKTKKQLDLLAQLKVANKDLGTTGQMDMFARPEVVHPPDTKAHYQDVVRQREVELATTNAMRPPQREFATGGVPWNEEVDRNSRGFAIKRMTDEAEILSVKLRQLGTVGQQSLGFMPLMEAQLGGTALKAKEAAENIQQLTLNLQGGRLAPTTPTIPGTKPKDVNQEIKDELASRDVGRRAFAGSPIEEQRILAEARALREKTKATEELAAAQTKAQMSLNLTAPGADKQALKGQTKEELTTRQLDFTDKSTGVTWLEDSARQERFLQEAASRAGTVATEVKTISTAAKLASAGVGQLTLDFDRAGTAAGKLGQATMSGTGKLSNEIQATTTSIDAYIAQLDREVAALNKEGDALAKGVASHKEYQRSVQMEGAYTRVAEATTAPGQAVQPLNNTNRELVRSRVEERQAVVALNAEMAKLNSLYNSPAPGVSTARQEAANRLYREGTITAQQYNNAIYGTGRALASTTAGYNSHARAAQQATSSAAHFVRQLWYIRMAAEMFAGFLMIRELKQSADGWINASNSVRLSTSSVKEATAVQEELVQVALRTRQPFDDVVTLYRRISMASLTVGASQATAIQFVENVGKALLIQGTSADAARGSLLQLGQMLGMGKIRMQEFNSISENTPRILKGIADHLQGGSKSIVMFRKAVEEQNRRGGGLNWKQLIKGKEEETIDSSVVFKAFLADTSQLDKEVDTVQRSFAQGFNNLSTNVTKFVGEINEAYKISDKFNTMIDWLGGNLDKLAASLGTVAAALAALAIPAALSGISKLIGQTAQGAAVSALPAWGVTPLTAAGGVATRGAVGAAAGGAVGSGMLGFMSANPLGVSVAALAALTAGLYLFRDNIEVAGITLGDVFRTLGKIVSDTFPFLQKLGFGAPEPVATALQVPSVVPRSEEGVAWGYNPKDDASMTSHPYGKDIIDAAKQFDVSVHLIAAVMKQESNNNPNALSPVGAIGLMQLMPKTAADLGVNPNVPKNNIEGGTSYLRELLNKFDGSVEKALAGYNGGPNRADKVNGGKLLDKTKDLTTVFDQLADETKLYIALITRDLNKRAGYKTDVFKDNTSPTSGSTLQNTIAKTVQSTLVQGQAPGSGASLASSPQASSVTSSMSSHKPQGIDPIEALSGWDKLLVFIERKIYSLFEWITKATITIFKGILNGILGSVDYVANLIPLLLRSIPSVLTDIFSQALSGLAQLAAPIINTLIDGLNSVAQSAIFKKLFGTTATITPVKFEVENNAKGSFDKLLADMEKLKTWSFSGDRIGDWTDGVMSQLDGLISKFRETAKARTDAANKGTKDDISKDAKKPIFALDKGKIEEYKRGLEEIQKQMSPVFAAQIRLDQAKGLLDASAALPVAAPVVQPDGTVTQETLITMAERNRLLAAYVEHSKEALFPLETLEAALEREISIYKGSSAARKGLLQAMEDELKLKRELGHVPTTNELAAQSRINKLQEERAEYKRIAQEVDRLYSTINRRAEKPKVQEQVNKEVLEKSTAQLIKDNTPVIGHVNPVSDWETGNTYATPIFGQTDWGAVESGIQSVKMDLRDLQAEANIQSGEGTFFDGMLKQIDLLSRRTTDFARQLGSTFAKPVTQLIDGIGTAFARAIVFGENLEKTLGDISRNILAELLSSLIKIGLQFLVNRAIATMGMATATAAGATMAAETGAMWAGPAALVSIATFGAAGLAADASMLSTAAIAAAIGGAGMKSGGYTGDSPVNSVAGFYHGQEYVLNATATKKNRPLLEDLNKGKTITPEMFRSYSSSTNSTFQNKSTYQALDTTSTVKRDLISTGYMVGGYTGDGPTGEVAGLVHGQEYVVNAEATRRYRPMLEALNRGSSGAGGGGSPGKAGASGTQVNVKIENYTPSNISVERNGNDIRIIAREEALAAVQTHTPSIVARDIINANSRVSKALSSHTTTGRKR